MDLNTLWFAAISVLFIGFFIFEGFDYGVGILMPFLGRDRRTRALIVRTIGPFWDGNEVWMLTAGGAIFAAFPHWYATLFSGFFLALVLLLLTLILRGVAFEFKKKQATPAWQTFWDWMIFVGSFVPALLWGVAFGNILRGVPIDASMTYTGGFWNLLNPFALLCGVLFVLVFTTHGALFISLRTTGELAQRAERTAARFIVPTLIVAAVYGVIAHTPARGLIMNVGALVALLLSWLSLRNRRTGRAFTLTVITIFLVAAGQFAALYPNVMISTLNPDWNLTIYNASSSPYTLRIMTWVAAIFLPLVLLYHAWTYWTFHKRVTDEPVEY